MEATDKIECPADEIKPTAPKVKRTRKCKMIVACTMIENDTAMVPVPGFPENIVSEEKAQRWVVKNAKENDGPREVILVKLLGSIHITSETKLKVQKV